MNIFVLDYDIKTCAEYHCDKHVVKMILESAQILCTVASEKGKKTSYKPTHKNHPCVLWAGESFENFLWLMDLTIALNDEYRFRYDKLVDHKSISVVSELSHFTFENIGLTDFAQCMPEEYKCFGNPVQAYRQYYLGEKLSIAKWTNREIPEWII